MAVKNGDRPVLKVEKRKLRGRKVKSLRRQGILPANIYGRDIKSLAVQGDLQEIQKIFSQVGETSLINLMVKGEKTPRAVLLHTPQLDPVSDQLVHIDFRQVDLTQKVNADIPVEVSGESPAVDRGEGVLVHILQEIEVEALPSDLPEKLIVDISSLEKVDQGITVAELVKSSGIDTKKVTVKTGADQLVIKIEPPTKEEEAAPVEEVTSEEAAASEGEEKGETKPEEGKGEAGKKEQPESQEKPNQEEKKS